jgi:hypothetical protein
MISSSFGMDELETIGGGRLMGGKEHARMLLLATMFLVLLAVPGNAHLQAELFDGENFDADQAQGWELEPGWAMDARASNDYDYTSARLTSYWPDVYLIYPMITLYPASGYAGSEVTVIGTGFDIYGVEFPRVTIYFNERRVGEEWIETDGSFSTTFTVTADARPSSYEVVARGPRDSASAEFVVTRPEVFYTVSVSTSPFGLSPSPTGGGTYTLGETVTVAAQPVHGYEFLRWTEYGDPISTAESYTFTVANYRNLVAEYSRSARPTIALYPAADCAGSEVTVIGTGFDVYGFEFPGEVTVIDTGDVGVVIVPKVTIDFNGWSVGEALIEADGSFSTTFTVTADATPGSYEVVAEGPRDSASAEFVVTRPVVFYTVSVSASPFGLRPSPTGGGTYALGETATVTAQPVHGYEFLRWTEYGDLISTAESCTFTVANYRNLVAEYSRSARPTIALYPVSDCAGCEVTVIGTDFDVYGVELPSVTIYFNKRSVGEAWIEADGSFSTMFTVTSDIAPDSYEVVAEGPLDSASAEFVVTRPDVFYTVSVSTSPFGLRPSPTGGGTYALGETVTVTAQPVHGYEFLRWTEYGDQISTAESYTFTVDNYRNLVAEYSRSARPTIALYPASDCAGCEVTVIGTGFDVYGVELPSVTIYFNERSVGEGWIEADGSFSTTFTVTADAAPGSYEVVVRGPRESASAEFVVIPPSPPPRTEVVTTIIILSTIITAAAISWSLYVKTGLPVHIEPRGGAEAPGELESRQFEINVEGRGGLEGL